MQQAAIYDKRYRGEIPLDNFKYLTKQITDPWLATMADKTLKEWEANKARREDTPCIIFVIGESFQTIIVTISGSSWP